MKLFFSDAQLSHQPQQFMVHGRIAKPTENADRATTLAASLVACGLTLCAPGADDLGPILKVHADHYIDFLRDAHAEFMLLPNHGPEVLPNIHPYIGANAAYARREKPRTTGIIGKAGWYMGDLAAVIGEGTYGAAVASAQTAISAARMVLGGESAAYALCRPPGHHAYADRATGFCFFNNAAIAAELLRARFGKVAILDFDTHHGDGTQAIFYERGDVFFGSVHTDPSAYYPFFIGYAEETGAGAGLGANLNLPLAPGADDAAFIAANEKLIAAALSHGAEAFVLSAGWDAHHRDPLSRLKVTSDAFARIGALYGAVGLPIVLVQEGGYSLEASAEASSAFIRAFQTVKAL